MADCSKTEVFLAEWMRICDNNNTCAFCPASGYLCKKCYMYDRSKLEEHKKTISTMIATVQNWSDEHPAPKPKTYADVFREKFPKNTIQDWALWQHEICRKQLFEGADTERCEGDCVKCWNEPYEGDNTNG